ncbi:hypothetical protein GHT06_004564 [Daphnia sinensis]|uniref:Uncharacterized protein n=1 Tax=Daphnia sinensis TaxID=1820382 RepID=A0AAD5KGI0_9CRUS|nr:hypothetical protein GHT06_004564 [Daphnia sinensis]
MWVVPSDTPPVFSSQMPMEPEAAEEIRATKGPDRLADGVAGNRIGAIVVLAYLKGQENASLSLSALASKLATLLALATLFRASDLASVDLKSIVFVENRVSFALSRLHKAQKSGSLQSFSLERLDDELLDPVACLRAYIRKTEVFRGPHNEGLLFISSVGQHNPVKSYNNFRLDQASLKSGRHRHKHFLSPLDTGSRGFEGSHSGTLS